MFQTTEAITCLKRGRAYADNSLKASNLVKQPESHGASDWVDRGLPLLRPIAENLKRSLPRAIETDDLIQAGALALIQLARKYDAAQGVPFKMWATFRIRGAMIDSIKGKPFREAKHAPLKDIARSTIESPEETAIGELEVIEARRTVAAWRDDQRSLLAALLREGSVRSLSRKMGLSESTTQRRIARCFCRIRPRTSYAALTQALLR